MLVAPKVTSPNVMLIVQRVQWKGKIQHFESGSMPSKSWPPKVEKVLSTLLTN